MISCLMRTPRDFQGVDSRAVGLRHPDPHKNLILAEATLTSDRYCELDSRLKALESGPYCTDRQLQQDDGAGQVKCEVQQRTINYTLKNLNIISLIIIHIILIIHIIYISIQYIIYHNHLFIS